jgi:adenylylsulfate kinase
MVIWITGLSASGKTTLSKAFEKKYKSAIPNMVLLDGDVIRQLYGLDLGYSESDREKQIKRIQSIARFLEEQSIVVIVAALYSHEGLLKYNRENFKNYFEVYLEADINFLMSRETKKLYEKALKKEIDNVVGVDIPWNQPQNPDLIFKVSEGKTPEEMCDIIYNLIFLERN